ncbi:MAG: hypothetical protein ACRENB_00330 [Gemmatimonadales bacterium]
MKLARPLVVLLVAAAGLVAGWAMADRYLVRHRAALFSRRARRRHAALGYLAGRPTPENVRLLRDYVAWEPHPILRRRAQRVIRSLELALG